MTEPVTMTFTVKGPLFNKPALVKALGNELDLFGRAVTSRLKTYPAQQQGKRHTFRSDRERRGFFYHLRRGDIKVPYKRTRTLARAWSNETRATLGGEFKAIIGLNTNIAPYGPFVEGLLGGDKALSQSADMKERGWPSVETVAKEEWMRAIPRFVKALSG